MKAVSQEFKNAIKTMGREIDGKIIYTLNNSEVELGANDINSISMHYEGAILKSVMKQLDIDSSIDIPIGTILEAKFGVFTGSQYEYISYGNFIVYSSEKQEDLKSYKIVCYDKMLYAMKEYTTPSNLIYPTTIRSYLSNLCGTIGLTFKNSYDTFPNYDKLINEELYLDAEGKSLDYIFRDVLDDIAQVVAGTICINKDDELEIRYINNVYDLTQDEEFISEKDYYTKSEVVIDSVDNLTNNQANTYRAQGYECTRATGSTRYTCELKADSYTLYDGDRSGNPSASNLYELETIDEEYLKDINVNFGEQYGPINTITFKRTNDLDVYSLSNPVDLADDLKNAIVISDNQILNGTDRNTYAQAILDKLYGTTFYLNDYKSTGIGWLELCDKYNVSINNVTYPCVMLNDELNITQGVEENIFTNKPKESETDYATASKSEREDNRASIIIDKKIGEVDIRGKNINLTSDNITISSTNFSVDETGNITANSGDIGGFHIGEDRLWNRIEASEYTMEDVYGASQYITYWGTMSDDERTAFLSQYGFSSVADMFAKWDVAPIDNPDGVINIADVMAMQSRFVDFSASGIDLIAGKDNTPGSILLSGPYSDEAVKISADGSITLNKIDTNQNFNTLKINANGVDGDFKINGTLEFGNNGYIFPSVAGYTTDQYGNFRHKRNEAGDYLIMYSNSGSPLFKYYWETGELKLNDKHVYSEEVLFTGDTNDVTLSDNASNYTYLEIWYRSNDGAGHQGYTKVYAPHGKQFVLSYTYLSGYLYFKQSSFYIWDNKITQQWGVEWYFGNGVAPSFNNASNISITRVVGVL